MHQALGAGFGRPRRGVGFLMSRRRRRPAAPEPSVRTGPLFGSPQRVTLAGLASLAAGHALAAALTPREPQVRPARRRRRVFSRIMRQRAVALLHGAAALLSFSGMTDSGLEHSQAHYRNRFMYVAPGIGALGLLTALRRLLSRHPAGRGTEAVYGLLGVTGAAGLGFHVYNVLKRPGGFSWMNLFYAAPLGAPGAMLLGGLFGLAGKRLEEPGAGRHGARTLVGGGRRSRRSAAERLGLAAAAGLLGTVAEVALLHFRGAWQNPYMVLPVTVPPAAAVALAAEAVRPGPATAAAARALTGATALLGLAGVVFHAYGIHRNMGGWRNWSQMILQGPPLPAPPGFTGVALAGLAAVLLLEDERA